MSEPLVIKNSLSIHAPIARVWDALVNPNQTKKYMFGCKALSDWKPGSELVWEMEYEGKEMIAVKGNIVEIVPEKLLVYTVFDPHSTLEDIPENYLTVTYTLKAEQGKTTLTVTQGDYNKVAEGKRRYEESYNQGQGWNPILLQIKELVEEAD